MTSVTKSVSQCGWGKITAAIQTASIEDKKFLNPLSIFDRASSGDRAHRPKEGSMQIRT
jgi:hypothetical protein